MQLRPFVRLFVLAVIVGSVAVTAAPSLADTAIPPSGSWSENATVGRYHGASRLRALTTSFVIRSAHFTPTCPAITCSASATLALRNGRHVSTTLHYVNEVGSPVSHETRVIALSGRACGRRATFRVYLGLSTYADESGQPYAQRGLFRVDISAPRCGSGTVIARVSATPTP